MPTMKLVTLPYVDEDGFFEGLCSAQVGEGIELPAHVLEIEPPADPENFFYTVNESRDGWIAYKKPTTAEECIELGEVSHTSQTKRCTKLRELFQKLTEGSTEYRVKRGEDLSWAVERIPEQTLDEAREAKFSELDSSFNSWYSDGATMISSLGFEADCDSRAMQDVNGLVTAAEAKQTFDADGGLIFMDAKNVGHSVTLQDLKTLQLEIISAGNAAYQEKWTLRANIEAAKTKEDLAQIEIAFHPADFSKASE